MEPFSPQHYQRLLRVAQRITMQRDTLRLCEVILDEARLLARADGGMLYLLDDGAGARAPQLECVLLRWPALVLCQGGAGGVPVTAAPVAITGTSLHPAVRAVLSGEVLVGPQPGELAGVPPDMREQVEHSLVVPLLNHGREVLGVLQLFNARDAETAEVTDFPPRLLALVSGVANYAAIALHNVLLVQEMEQLLDAFIKVIARAVDEKSSHTSGHCQRVPLLTELLAGAACEDQQQYADFSLTDDEWYELRVAAWLHDCGKLTTPDSVLDKSTKLHTLHDRIDEVATRFAVLRVQYQAECAAAVADEPQAEEALTEMLARTLETLADELAFLRRINVGSERMAEADQQRVREIAMREWRDAEGQRQPLLTEEEVAALCIVRGTLTPAERDIINNHIQVTLDMLESLPFPRKLRRVPEYAGGHHERIDGTGFPRGLTGEQMSLPARMMAIADVFEALTAHDRPYKPPMKISEALGILRRMRDARHIDAGLYELFIRARVWESYALQVLDPAQLDVSDASPYL